MDPFEYDALDVLIDRWESERGQDDIDPMIDYPHSSETVDLCGMTGPAAMAWDLGSEPL